MTDRIELSDSRGITRILIIVPESITVEVPSGVPGHRPVTPVTSQIWDDAKIHLKNKDGTEDVLLIDGNHLIAGGGGQSGIVTLRTGDERNTIRLNGSTGEVTVGGNGENGQIFLENQAGNRTIILNGAVGDVTFGGNGQNGRVFVRDQAGKIAALLDSASANLTLGGNDQAGHIFLQNREGRATLRLDGQAGDISLENGDCAEDFAVSVSSGLEPGDVTVLDDDATLCRSERPYDRRVAGVISGAATLRPGLVLGRDCVRPDRLPLALIGRVYCKVDAQYGAVTVGDLLTTSQTPGHAMKASDPAQAFGAIIGKALAPLREGQDLIPILVAMQ